MIQIQRNPNNGETFPAEWYIRIDNAEDYLAFKAKMNELKATWVYR